MDRPANHGMPWTRTEDKYLSKSARRWHTLTIYELASRHRRTVVSIAERLKRLAISDLRTRGFKMPETMIEGQDVLKYVRAQPSGFTDRALRQIYGTPGAAEQRDAKGWTRSEDRNLLRGVRFMQYYGLDYFASKHQRMPEEVLKRIAHLAEKEFLAEHKEFSGALPPSIRCEPMAWVRAQRSGFTDRAVEAMWGETVKIPIAPSFPKMFNPYPYQRKIIDELCNWPKERPDVVWIGTGEALHIVTEKGLSTYEGYHKIFPDNPVMAAALERVWKQLQADIESKSNSLMFRGVPVYFDDDMNSQYRWYNYGLDFALKMEPKQEKPMETDFHVVFDAANPDRTSRAMPKAEALEEINRRLLRDPLRPVYLLKAEQSFVIGKPVAAKLKPAKVVRVKAARKATK